MIYMMSALVVVCCTALITIISEKIYEAKWDIATAVRARHDYEDKVDPFKAAAYLSRIEDVYLQILKTAQPVDWTITLWLGLDGLRIDTDGSTEWIKRIGPTPQACAGPLLPYRLPTPPPPGCSVLYADNRSIEIAAPCDQTMSIQAQIDKLRTEMAIMSLQTQIQQACVTPPFYPGWMQYPQTCMTQPFYPCFMPYPQYKI